MIHIEQFKDTIYEKGYGNVAKLVMVDKTISIGAKALYSYLCSYAFGKGEAYPTVERIMQELNISENSFRRYRKELEDKGYITIEFRNIKGTNRNVYKINNSVEQKKEPQNLTPSKFGTLPKSTPSKFGTQIIKDSKEYNNKNIINNKEKNKKETQKDTHVKNNIDIALEKVNAISNDKLNIIFLQNNITSLILKLFDELGTDKTIETLENIKENNFIMKTWKNNYSKEEMFISKILKLETFIKISCGMYDETKNIDISVIQSDEELLKKYDF